MLASSASTPAALSATLQTNGGPRNHYLRLVSGELRGAIPSLERLGLRIVSVPYGLAVRLRNAAYHRGLLPCKRVAAPVVSIGNLTAGGTGKTPCVEYIARFYHARDRRVAILSRGYGGRGARNDEALLLEENLPQVTHLQGANRVILAQKAIEQFASEILLLDDGFQHRRLARDLELVLIDATVPWGYGHLLPRGLLREPISSLQRAAVVMLTRCDQVPAELRQRLRKTIGRIVPTAPVIETTHRAVRLCNSEQKNASLDLLRQGSVYAFCGIGNPESFRRALLDLGGDLRNFRIYPDHHAYGNTDVVDLSRWADSLPSDGILVTTQKDLVKLRRTHLGERALWSLRICLCVESGQEVLDGRLQSVLPPVEGRSREQRR